jgi:hypothetical protein
MERRKNLIGTPSIAFHTPLTKAAYIKMLRLTRFYKIPLMSKVAI